MAEDIPSTSSSSDDDNQPTLQSVPDVVLSHVLSYLTYEQISQLRSVSYNQTQIPMNGTERYIPV